MISNIFSSHVFLRFAMLGMLLPMALGVEGCCCGDECDTGTDGGVSTASIAFEYPRAGNVLTPADDLDGNIANGIQIDVAIRYSGDSSNTITLTSDQLSNGITASITNGMGTFESVTIAASEAGTVNTLTVSDGSLSRTLTVTGSGLAVADSCSFTSPLADATISEDADLNAENFQIATEIACSGSGVAAGQTITVNAGLDDATGTLDANGAASVEVSSNTGAITLTATLTNTAGETLATVSQSNTVSPPNSCAATIASPADNDVFNAASVDTNSGDVGFQTNISVTTGDSSNCSGADVSVSVNGTAFTALADATGAADVEVTLPEGTVTIVATVTNVAGAGATDSVTVLVDRTAPEISITSPVNNQAFNPGSDVTLAGSVTGFSTGSYSVSCTGNDGGTTVDSTAITTANFSETISGLEGSSCTITVAATDAASNSASEDVTITFQDLSGPQVLSIEVVDDANADQLLTLAESGDPEGSAQSDVVVTFSPSAPLEDGQTVFMTVTGQGVPLEATSADNSATFVDVDLPQGGVAFTVTDDTEDATGNPIDPEFSYSITVNTIPTSEVAVTSPEDGRVYGPSDDADDDFSNGLTIQLTGTLTNASSASYTLTCTEEGDAESSDGGTPDADAGTNESGDGGSTQGDGGTPEGTFVQSGDLSEGAFDLTLTDIDQPDCSLVIEATDGTNPVTFTRTFTIGNVALSVAINGDADDNDYFTASEDADPVTDTDMDVNIAMTANFVGGSYTGRADVYDCVSGTCDDGDETLVNAFQLGALTSGVETTGTVTVPYGDENTYEVRVFAVPVVGEDEGPASASFVVDTQGPGLTWQAPLDGQALNSTNDQSLLTPEFEAFIAVDATGMPAGATVTFTLTHETTGAIDPAPTCVVGGTFVCRRLDVVLTDGAWTAVATGSDAAGNVGTSETRNFSVDATGPQVESIAVVDDANTDGTLNLAESGDATGSASSDITVTFTDALPIEDGLTVTLEVTGAADQTASSSGNAVTFTAVPLAEGIVGLTVVAVDAANNGIVTDGSESASITVDTVAPTVSIGAPTAATLLASDDKDPATADLQIDVTVLTNAANGQTVELFDDATSLGTAASNGTSAVFSDATLAQGARSLTATVSDAAGNSSTSAAYTPLVDSIAPTLRITSPAHQSTHNDTPPVAVNFDVAHTGLAATDTICLTSDVEGADFACAAAGVDSDVGEQTTTIAAAFNQEATHTIVVSAADANTNEAVVSAEGANPVDGSIEVNIVTGNFTVSVSAPADSGGTRVIGNAQIDAGNVTVTVSVPNDTGMPVASATLTLGGVCTDGATRCSGPDGGECGMGTCDTNQFQAVETVDTQAATFTIAATEFQDAQTAGAAYFGVSVANATPKTGTSGVLDFNIDVGDPTVTITSPASPATVGLGADVNGAVDGVQIELGLDITNCEDGSISVTAPGTPAPSGFTTVDATGTQSGNLQVTVEDGDDQMWTVSCTDAVGNVGTSANLEIDADLVAPGAISDLALSVPAGEHKQGTVDITFTAPGDDDATGTASIEIVASTGDFSGLNAAAFDALFDAAVANDFATYAQPGMDRRVTQLTMTGGGVGVNEQATGLAFDSTNAGGQTWTIAVRATDEAGNASRASDTVTFTTSAVTISGVASNLDFGRGSHASGDLNGDGKDDLVIADRFADLAGGAVCTNDVFDPECAGSVTIYAGVDDLDTISASKTINSDTEATLSGLTSFGMAVTIANLNADGFDDLVVSMVDPNTGSGKLGIFYGNNTADMVDAPIFINLDVTPCIDGANFICVIHQAAHLQNLGDINADNRDDIGMASCSDFFCARNIYTVMLGSSTKPTNNSNLSSNGVGAKYFYIQDINSDYIRHATPIGNLNEDSSGFPLNDFVLSVQQYTGPGAADLPTNYSYLAVVDGREFMDLPDPGTGGLNIGCDGACGGDASSHDLDVTDLMDCGGANCGTTVSTGDINGDGKQDLLVMDGYVAGQDDVEEGIAVYLADDADANLLGTTDGVDTTRRPSYRLSPAQFVFNNTLAGGSIGDVNNDGYDDVLFGTRSVGVDNSQFQLFLGGVFDTNNGLSGDPVSRTANDASYEQIQNLVGYVIKCGDLNGDGNDELCFGGPEGSGEIIIRY